ncbi:MAG: hypothetical protein KAT16_05655 [Candidatus Heimdallarchaeota archaeon]|nr:hypothetical protein [Candidatus Heimdallarchaeota archaeon]
MALAQTYPNYSSYLQDEEILTINFDSLLLSILTSFNIEVTENELLLNVRNLFVDLNFEIPDNISKDVQDSLPSLLSNHYLEYRDGKYQLSNKGKALGLKALKNFQEFVPKFIRN